MNKKNLVASLAILAMFATSNANAEEVDFGEFQSHFGENGIEFGGGEILSYGGSNQFAYGLGGTWSEGQEINAAYYKVNSDGSEHMISFNPVMETGGGETIASGSNFSSIVTRNAGSDAETDYSATGFANIDGTGSVDLSTYDAYLTETDDGNGNTAMVFSEASVEASTEDLFVFNQNHDLDVDQGNGNFQVVNVDMETDVTAIAGNILAGQTVSFEILTVGSNGFAHSWGTGTVVATN